MNDSCAQFIGIDPDLNGAVAIDWGKTVEIVKFPLVTERINRRDALRLNVPVMLSLARLIVERRPGDTFVVIEKTGGIPGQSATTSYSLGQMFGDLRTTFLAAGADVLPVHPIKWKNHFRLSSDKERSLQKAKTLWPHSEDVFTTKRKVRDKKNVIGNAESALLARYCRDNFTAN